MNNRFYLLILTVLLFSCQSILNKFSPIVTFVDDEVRQAEFDVLNKVKLPFPRKIRRFFIDENGEKKIVYSECIYDSKSDGLINGQYVYLKVYLFGDSSNYTIKYDYSLGKMYSSTGIGFKSSLSNFIETNEGYGTGSGSVEVKKNGNQIFYGGHENIDNNLSNNNSSNSEIYDGNLSNSNELSYSGKATDEQSGISQDYVLNIKSDFSSASLGGGPYTRIEDQGNGIYMWLDGTIIGMSFKPMKERCIVYGSDGAYFCTLYRN
jgi:hypothetical protein